MPELLQYLINNNHNNHNNNLVMILYSYAVALSTSKKEKNGILSNDIKLITKTIVIKVEKDRGKKKEKRMYI